MSESSLCIATSLAPGKGEALQSAAVESWRAAGAEVFSFNSPAEHEALSAYSDRVTFVSCERTGEALTGKPVVFLADIMAWFQKRDPALLGIFNSDIVIETPAPFMEKVRAHVPGTLLAGRRRDVESLEDPAGESYARGFDYFFMESELLPFFSEDAAFCLGMPFWDYWLPFVGVMQGVPLKRLALPQAIHPRHDIRWGETVFTFMHRLLDSVLALARRKAQESGDESAKIMADFFSYYYGHMLQDLSRREVKDLTRTELATLYDRFNEFMVHTLYACGDDVTP